MEHPTFSPPMPIAAALAVSPRVAQALLELRVDCVGCSMSKFCAIAEMCARYALDLELVLRKLEKETGRAEHKPGY